MQNSDRFHRDRCSKKISVIHKYQYYLIQLVLSRNKYRNLILVYIYEIDICRSSFLDILFYIQADAINDTSKINECNIDFRRKLVQ